MKISLVARIALLSTCLSLAACGSSGKDLGQLAGVAGAVLGQSGAGLGSGEIARGLKEALSKSSQIVVSQVGKPGGYLNDPAIHVPLPNALVSAKKIGQRVGMDGFFNDLEGRLNKAAELAAPKAQSIFLGAIQQMTFNDATQILNGPDDAATQFFQRSTSDQLRSAMRPLVDESLAQVGAVNSFNNLLKTYQRIPLAPKVEADLTTHVLNEGMKGLFYYIAKEEQAIRNNPLKRTSALLQKVFGAAGS